MQGQLLNKPVAVEIETTCRHCGQAVHITVDSVLRASVREEGATPLMFSPDVDFDHLAQRTIIDSY